ncbi:hypothetical protein [Devosia sp. LjRoot3]|uniref:hypothetical protein n=1 Tax=Devosia sp. LjRoot3 TaxID=3342319 RepID=UPI003ED01E29
MGRIADFFWPTLERLSQGETEAAASALVADLNAIHAIESASSSLLEEARRLTDQETATRASIETRGGIYLATIGTLIPIIVFVADAVTTGTSTTIQNIIIIIMSVVASLYLFGAGRWALKALAIDSYHRFGVSDFRATFASKTPELVLAKALLQAVRHNRAVINQRVTSIRITQMFIWRAVVVLIGLLLVAVIPNSVSRLIWPPEQTTIAVCRFTSQDAPAVGGEFFDLCRMEPAER